MKHLKNALSLLLVLVIAMSLGLPVFAAQETSSITIKNAVPGTKYKVYRIFDLESRSGDAYSYKIRSDGSWADFANSISGSDPGHPTLIEISNGYITPIYNGSPLTDATENSWSEALLAEAKAWITAHSPSCSCDASATVPDNQDFVTIGNLPSGYYFADTTLGSLCILNTFPLADSSAVIVEKNVPPTVDKETFDNDPQMDHHQSDASVGDFVKFAATVHVKEGAAGYQLVDSMKNGLVFEQDEKHPLTVQIKDVGTVSLPIAAADDTWQLNGQNGASGFTVTFSDHFIANQIGKELLVTYYGKLTEEAVNHTSSINQAVIQYGEDSQFESKASKTDTYTYKLKVVKYTEQQGSKIALEGAQFQLKKLSGTDVQKTIQLSSCGNVYTVDPAGTADTIITDKSGFFTIQGLDAGTYYLCETKSPDGYNQLAAPIKISISHGGTVTYDDSNAVTGIDFELQQPDGSRTPVEGAVPVLNQTGSVLPSTGGIGTTIFYVVGALLMIAALVLFITRKKLSGEKTDD